MAVEALDHMKRCVKTTVGSTGLIKAKASFPYGCRGTRPRETLHKNEGQTIIIRVRAVKRLKTRFKIIIG